MIADEFEVKYHKSIMYVFVGQRIETLFGEVYHTLK